MKTVSGNKIFIIVLFFIVLLTLAKAIYDKRILEVENRFTIGIVHDYVYTSNSEIDFYFKFKIRGKEYDRISMNWRKPKHYINKRVFVKYQPSNPRNAEIMFDIPVPDTLQHIPANGWEELPVRNKKR